MQPDEQKPVVTPAPTSVVTPPTAVPQPNVPTPRKKINKNIIIGIVVGAVVLVGIIGWAVYAAISNSPDNLMKAAVQNLVNEKQLAGAMKIQTGAADAPTTVTGDFAFAVDPANDKNAQVTFGLGSDDKRFGLHALVLDKTAYLKVSKVENLGTLFGDSEPSASGVAEMFKAINDQWFELSEQDVQSLASTTGGTATPVAGASTADLKRVTEIYGQYSFIKADQIFADEVVDGANSAHFSLRLDRDQYVKFMQAVKAANLETVKIADKDIEDAKKEQERPTDGSVELWIARDSKKFKQLRVVNTAKGEESTITVTFTGTMPQLEKYEKPAGAKSISELMTMLFGGSMNTEELNALQNSQSSEDYLTQ